MTEKTEPCRNQPKYYKLLQIRYHKHKVSLFKRATPGVFLKNFAVLFRLSLLNVDHHYS